MDANVLNINSIFVRKNLQKLHWYLVQHDPIWTFETISL
jgi:hypothetical protein